MRRFLASLSWRMNHDKIRSLVNQDCQGANHKLPGRSFTSLKPNTKHSRRLMRSKGEYDDEYSRSNRWWTTSLLQIADNIFDQSSLTNTKFIRVSLIFSYVFSDTKLVS